MSFRLFAVALIALTSTMCASTITREAAISSAFEVSAGGAYPEFVGLDVNSSELLLPEFNPSLGTLTSVELTLSLNISTLTSVTNSVLGILGAVDFPVSLLLTPSNTDDLQLSVDGIPLITTTASSLPAPTTLAPGNGTASTSSTTLSSTNVGSPFFSFFTGEGVASASLMSTDSYILQSQGLGATSFAGEELVTPVVVTLDGSLKAVYTYTAAVATPEPGFTAVIGLFLIAGMAAVRRRA